MEETRPHRFPSPFHPVFGQRPVAWGIVLSVGVPLALNMAGVLHWTCPTLLATGWPCFGCGTVRALRAVLRLDVADAIAFNPFAPVYLFALLVLAVPAMVGTAKGECWIRWVREKDRAYGLSLIVLISHAVWGTVRIAAS